MVYRVYRCYCFLPEQKVQVYGISVRTQYLLILFAILFFYRRARQFKEKQYTVQFNSRIRIVVLHVQDNFQINLLFNR